MTVEMRNGQDIFLLLDLIEYRTVPEYLNAIIEGKSYFQPFNCNVYYKGRLHKIVEENKTFEDARDFVRGLNEMPNKSVAIPSDNLRIEGNAFENSLIIYLR